MILYYSFWATVTNGSPYTTGPLYCLSCLSVTLVYCGKTVRWIMMPLGTEVGLGPGDVVLDGDPSPRKGAQQPPPHFSARVYCGWPNGRPSRQLLSSCTIIILLRVSFDRQTAQVCSYRNTLAVHLSSVTKAYLSTAHGIRAGYV